MQQDPQEEGRIGDRVKARRKQLGLSQDELLVKLRSYAEGHKIWKESLSRIENNRQKPGAWMLEALAYSLDTTTDFLMGLADDPGVDVPNLPVPAMDIAPLVDRLNRLDPKTRETFRVVIEAMLKLVEPARRPLLSREDFARLFAGLSEEEQIRQARQYEEWLREMPGGGSAVQAGEPPRPGDQQEAGKRAGKRTR